MSLFIYLKKKVIIKGSNNELIRSDWVDPQKGSSHKLTYFTSGQTILVRVGLYGPTDPFCYV